ncbi:MAG: hypothetical protein U0470_04195 [Anaerolineae bacterium]
MPSPQPACPRSAPHRAGRLVSSAVAALAFVAAASTAAAQAPLPAGEMHFERLGSFGGAVTGIVADGTRAFVSRGERIDTFDVTEPGAPRFIATSEPLGGVATVVGAGGGRLLATVRSSVDGDVQERLVVFATDGARPEATGDLGVEVRGDRWVKAVEAAVTDGRTAFVAPGITDEAPPSRALQLRDLRALPGVAAAAFEMPSPVSDLALDGRWLYAATADGLTVLDVGDPLAPVVAGTLALPYARSIALHGAQALVAAAGGIHRVDIADPSAPAVVDRFAALSGAEVVVAGRDAWVATYGGLYTGLMATLTHFDADQPGMRVVGYGVHDLRGMVAVGDRLLTAEGRTGFSSLAMVDGRDPYVEPRWHADVLGDVAGLAQEAGLAYAADGDSELWVLDPADPASPRPVGRVDAPGEAFAPPKVSLGGLAVRDRMAYVTYLSGTGHGRRRGGDRRRRRRAGAGGAQRMGELRRAGGRGAGRPQLRGPDERLRSDAARLHALPARPDGAADDAGRGPSGRAPLARPLRRARAVPQRRRPRARRRARLAGAEHGAGPRRRRARHRRRRPPDARRPHPAGGLDERRRGRWRPRDRRRPGQRRRRGDGRPPLDHRHGHPPARRQRGRRPRRPPDAGRRARVPDGRPRPGRRRRRRPDGAAVLARLPLLGIRDDDGAVVRRVGDRLWVADGDVGIRIVRLAEGAEGEGRGGAVYLPWAGRR